MDDIVERLRFPPKPVHDHENYLVMIAAAKEIERLRHYAADLLSQVEKLKEDRGDREFWASSRGGEE